MKASTSTISALMTLALWTTVAPFVEAQPIVQGAAYHIHPQSGQRTKLMGQFAFYSEQGLLRIFGPGSTVIDVNLTRGTKNEFGGLDFWWENKRLYRLRDSVFATSVQAGRGCLVASSTTSAYFYWEPQYLAIRNQWFKNVRPRYIVELAFPDASRKPALPYNPRRRLGNRQIAQARLQQPVRRTTNASTGTTRRTISLADLDLSRGVVVFR